MNPGDLRHRITFQKLSDERDTFGQPLEQYTDIATVWASINPISGREYYAAETVNSEVSHKIRLRYRPGLTPDMIIKFGARTFEIISILNPQERNIELLLMCKELV